MEQNNENKDILSVKDLSVHFIKDKSVVKAVNHLSFSMKVGETLGLVVFPAPVSPTSPRVSPTFIEKDKWFTAFTTLLSLIK